MKPKRYTEKQIIGFLKAHEAEVKVENGPVVDFLESFLEPDLLHVPQKKRHIRAVKSPRVLAGSY